MSENTTYLITGANRGIGLAITTLLLTRPHTTVLATSRTPAASLTSFAGPIRPTSKLLPVLLDEANSAISSATLAQRLKAEHDITSLDVVVANAGSHSAMGGVLSPGLEEAMVHDFQVNAVGPARLFRGVWGLMEEGPSQEGAEGQEGGKEKEKKFVLITSSVGSIATLEQESLPTVAYGMSKAAANWFAKKVSVELRGRVVVGIVHPGWVKTAMGQALVDKIGFKEPPLSVEESAKGVVEQIDGLTPEKSGQYLTWTGDRLPW